MADVYTIEIIGRNNADFYVAFQFTDNDGVAVDITGGKFWMTLRQVVQAGEVPDEYTLSTDLGTIPLVTPLEGRWSIDQDQNVWETWDPGKYKGDLVYEVGGRRSVVAEVCLLLKDGITEVA